MEASFAKKIQQLTADLAKEKRPTDKQLLRKLRAKHPGWSREKIADTYGLSF